MSNFLWHNRILTALIGCGITLSYYHWHQKPTMAFNFPWFAEKTQTTAIEENNIAKESLLASNKTLFCGSLGEDYQEFYNFETRNYNISICFKDEQWFYYREAKSNPGKALVLPATIVFGGDVFKAVDGRTTYFVGTNSDGYYSSVMYGNNQMIFEPELPVTSNAAIASGENVTSIEIANQNTVDSHNPELSIDYWKVCTENREDLHPNLNGWQKFIGESFKMISEYATTNGHNFSYFDGEKKGALIETSDGLMVTMKMFQVADTVGSVCVNPIASY